MANFLIEAVFVFWISYLEFHILVRLSDVQRHFSTSFLAFLVLFFSFIFMHLEVSLAFLGLANALLALWLLFKPMWRRFWAMKTLEADLFLFVDQVILNIKSGQSFRSSYMSSIDCLRSNLAKKFIKDLFEQMSLEKKYFKFPKKVQDFCRYLVKIHKLPHKSLDHLCLLQRRWSFNESIKEEMDSALFQVRTQSFIMLFFFIPCSFWYFHKEGELSYFVLATFLFSLGFFIHFKIQKELLWDL